jgi:hypothetical protein
MGSTSSHVVLTYAIELGVRRFSARRISAPRSSAW